MMKFAQAWEIHAKAYQLVQIGYGTTFKTYRQTPMLQVQPGDLPVLGVHLLRERRIRPGNANHGEPEFVHDITLGFSGAVHVETDKQNDIHALEQWMAQLDDMLLSDPSFVNMAGGITAMDRVGQYAKVGETTLFEIRVEMSIASQSWFPPRVPDVLEKVVVDTQFPDAEHAASGTPQIHRVYELETQRKLKTGT
jgi:hypothetical protein